jgi:hypothetical protein
MELLQNRRYEAGEIPDHYFYEIRTLIKSMIDVCREGEIPLYEADCIIHEELLSCLDYQGELWEKLDNLDIGKDEITNTEDAFIHIAETRIDQDELGQNWREEIK